MSRLSLKYSKLFFSQLTIQVKSRNYFCIMIALVSERKKVPLNYYIIRMKTVPLDYHFRMALEFICKRIDFTNYQAKLHSHVCDELVCRFVRQQLLCHAIPFMVPRHRQYHVATYLL